jgi:glycosyltransferase involved in cell wall biosynthesis
LKKKSNQKILFLFNTLTDYVGYRAPLIAELISLGYEVAILAPNDSLVAYELIKKSPIVFESIDFKRRSFDIFSFFLFYKQFKKIDTSFKPDIVHCFRTQLIFISAVTLFFYKTKKIIYTFTGLGELFYNNSFFGEAVRKAISIYFFFFLRGDNKIITFQNHQDRKLMIKLGAVSIKNSMVLRGVDAIVDSQVFKLSLFVNKPYIQILFVGRLIKDKGIMDLISALKILKEESLLASWRCVVIGKVEPGQKDITESLVLSWEGEDLIKWIPEVKFHEIPHYYADSDIFCLPSYHEGLPRCLLECSAIGRPMVVTKNHGSVEIVKDGINGFIAQIGDVDQLSRALKNLIINKNLIQLMGDEARRLYDLKFKPEDILNEQVNLYDK